jgi:hypothetical protein
MEAITNREQLNKFYVEKCRGDKSKFQQELETLDFKKLSIVAKTLSMKVAGDKKSIAKALADKMAKTENKVKLPSLPEVDDTEVFRVKINPDYVDLVPRASQQDYEVLKHSIEKDGLQKKIEILHDGTIVDGHTRYQALQELKIFSLAEHTTIVKMEVKDIENYIFQSNFARRQLSDYAKIQWIKKYLPEIKKKVKEKGFLTRVEVNTGKISKPEARTKKTTTRKEVAKTTGVSEANQKKMNFLERYTPELLEDVINETVALNAQYEKANKWYQAIKKADEDLFERVRSGDISLEDAHLLLLEKKPEVVEEKRKVGPLETQGMTIRKMFEKVYKKYGADFESGPLVDLRKDFLEKLDLLIAKCIDKGI